MYCLLSYYCSLFGHESEMSHILDGHLIYCLLYKDSQFNFDFSVCECSRHFCAVENISFPSTTSHKMHIISVFIMLYFGVAVLLVVFRETTVTFHESNLFTSIRDITVNTHTYIKNICKNVKCYNKCKQSSVITGPC